MSQDPRNIFVEQRYGEEKTNQTQQQAEKSTADAGSYNASIEEMKRLAEKYQVEGEGQLVKDIVASVIEQKAKGKLTNAQLLEFSKRIYPLLNAEQRSRLDGLIGELIKL